MYDADPAERDPPDPPENPTVPSDELIADLVVASDFPGDRTRPPKHRNNVREAYRTLIEQGMATRDDLQADATVSNYDYPEQGHFVHREQWWRHCGRPALADLSGVHPPGGGNVTAGYAFKRRRKTPPSVEYDIGSCHIS